MTFYTGTIKCEGKQNRIMKYAIKYSLCLIISSTATHFSALYGYMPTKRVTMLIDVATPMSVVVVGKFMSSTACTSVIYAPGLVT